MATTDITPFLFEGESLVRVITKDDAPWFVLADVCAVLGLTNPTMVSGRLDSDEKQAIDFVTLRNTEGKQNKDLAGGKVTVINESGLYSLTFTSRKPAAKRFKKWVTADVLPTIRKTGRYESPDATVIDQGKPAEQVLDASQELKLVNTACRVYGVKAAQQMWLKHTSLPTVPAMFEPQQQPSLFDYSTAN